MGGRERRGRREKHAAYPSIKIIPGGTKKTGGGKKHESEIKTKFGGGGGGTKNVLPKVTTGEKGVWVSPVGIISKKILLS